jgi:hypothetical protein
VNGRDSLDLLQNAGTLFRQEQLLASPVLRAALSHNQPFCLKLVEQDHQAARQNSKMRGELTLISPRVDVDPSQDADMGRGYAESGDPAAKREPGVPPDLRQQQPELPRLGRR